MRVVLAIDPASTLWFPSDEWQAPALNETSSTSERPTVAIHHDGSDYLLPTGTVAGRAMPPPDVSEMAAHRVTQAAAIVCCRNIIAHFNAPKTGALCTLPKTATRKIQKFTLQARSHPMGTQP